jgi:FtsZ-binding cell division protein ZapB
MLSYFTVHKRMMHNESFKRLNKKYQNILQQKKILQTELEYIKKNNIELLNQVNSIKDKNTKLINNNNNLQIELLDTKKFLNINYFNIFK